ncbi:MULTISPECIES: DUF748 domain-containing protein [unclassified Dyella]|uniref:DUF748 domain-containing protein n=1 Tax=unclassified Dyella TaxID=2634549 RepID=UPI000C853F4F|nr:MULTISPECIES: DUF748 domain-containing protein [unclassified Dyella]MDR3446305.1 DUF748 domain-containing protein [Dyella sp.]PMQ02760.1 hypothetical protein DyAD56_23065 [Dyella sp. AD56]
MAGLFSNPRLAAGRDRALTIYKSHRTRKIVLILAIVVVVFGLLGFLAAPSIIRSQIEKHATAALQRPVTLGAVHLNPYTLRLELDQLHIADQDGKSPFVSIDQAVVNASWSSVFRLKPVLDELSLQGPRIRIVRTGDQRFNFSDIIDRINATPSDPKAAPTRFAISNISVHNGNIQFDDETLKTEHRVENLELGIPFIANLPSDTDVFVQPLLSMKVDGSPLRMEGHTKPFADSRESTIDFRLDRFDLARYMSYVPAKLPVAIPKGLLSGDLTLHFVQAKPTPQLQVTGKVELDDFALNSSDGQAILTLGKGTADLSDVQPLQSRYALGVLALDQAQLYYTSTADGHSNFDTLTAPPAQPADTKAQPTDLRIASITLANSAIHYANATGKIDLGSLHGGIQGLSMLPAPPAKLDVAAQFFGGELSMKGTVDLAKDKLVAALGTKQVDLAPLQAATYQGLAARLTSGKLDAAGQLQVDWGKPFNVHLSDAHTTVTDFAMEPQFKGHGSPVAWKTLESEIKQIDLASQQAQLGTVKANGLALDVQRNSNKYISLVDLFAAKDAPKKKAADNSPPWHWSIEHLTFDNAAVVFTDLAAGGKPVKIKIDSLSGGMDNLSDKLNEPREMKLAGNVDKGSFTASGKVQPLPTLADIQLDTKRLDISTFQPYISVPLNVTISSARISSNGKVHYDGRSADPKLTYKGDAALEQVRVQDKLTGDDFLRWRTLSGNQLDVSYGYGVPRMHVGSLVLSSFYARMIVNSNGTLNLSEVVANPEAAPVSVTRGENEQPVAGATPAPAAPAPTPPPAPAAASKAKSEVATATPAPASSAPEAPAADIRIGGLTLVNGQLNYTDNFIKPNYTANMTKVTGKIGAFGTKPGDPPADLSVQAALNDDSPIDIDGSINPLQPVAFLDIKGKANEVELTGMSAYSTKYTGYPITAGKLTMDVHYMLDQRKLNADNHIFITQLTFGDRDESPGVKHLPVKLAVALLKDTQGNIDVNVPVSGSLDDPQFSMGSLIWHALGNLIAKAATAPFRLLGAAFGGGNHEDLGYVEFDPGSAVLDKNAQERLGKIVTMLTQKPALNLDIIGRVDPSKDQDALRKVTVDNLVRRQKVLDQDGKNADTSDAALAAVNVTPDEYEKYLKRAYKDDDFKGKPKNFIGLKKSLEPDDMRSLMETNIAVDDAAMRDLAQRRATAVQAWLKGKLDDKRVSVKDPKLDTKDIDDKGKTTRVEFGLHQG